jgi:hypothetical protein
LAWAFGGKRVTTIHYVRLAIIAGVVVAGAFIFLPRGEWVLTAGVLVGVMAPVVVGQRPAPKAFILQHRKGVAIAGWTIAGVGILLAVLLSLTVSESLMAPGMVVSVFGASLASLSSSLKVSEEARGTASRLRLSGLQAGLDALVFPFRDLRSSAVVLGPWFALFVVAPALVFGSLFALGEDWTKHLSRAGAMAVLLAILATLLVMYGALMAAAIQWVRFVDAGRPPPFAVPWRSLWSFAWRWMVFGGVSRLPNQFGPWLNAHHPELPHWASISLTNLVGLAFLVLISPLGLVLPALALGTSDTSIARVMASVRAYGRSYYLGALVVLSPFAILSWLIDLLPVDHSKSTGAVAIGSVLLVIWAVSFFLEIPAAMTYLARARAAGRA